MKLYKKHRLWTAGVATLALLSLLAGTSFACFQREVASVRTVEDCCQKHCQHAMAKDRAAQCCQSHQAQVSQTLLASPAKALSLVRDMAYSLHIFPLATVALQDAERPLVYLTTETRPPPSFPLYVLYRTLLI
ncbi:MAG: hypothetical protein ACRERD_09100, partial [Candidatus Binatia bacterium]